jgi:kynureninase
MIQSRRQTRRLNVDGEHNIRTDVWQKINGAWNELALVLIGVNYHTGQAFDMKNNNCCCHEGRCRLGSSSRWGNIKLELHDWCWFCFMAEAAHEKRTKRHRTTFFHGSEWNEAQW